MRFAKQVIFTIFVTVFLTSCGNRSKTPEQAANAHNERARTTLEFVRGNTVYLYDSKTKMCLMQYLQNDARGSVALVSCRNVFYKLSPEHKTQYLADSGQTLEEFQKERVMSY